MPSLSIGLHTNGIVLKGSDLKHGGAQSVAVGAQPIATEVVALHLGKLADPFLTVFL